MSRIELLGEAGVPPTALEGWGSGEGGLVLVFPTLYGNMHECTRLLAEFAFWLLEIKALKQVGLKRDEKNEKVSRKGVNA